MVERQMAFPAEFEQYREQRKSEENFIQRFLKPLLVRLGYYSVRDYHGTREFGKDLVYAEIDRFAEVAYHGLQAKFEESVGLPMAEDLAQDAIQAFTNPFEHPTTHQPHRIATFVAVNAGSVSEQARTHFFNRVGPHAGSCRILDGKDLLGLDRVALSNSQAVAETLDGIFIEIKFNSDILAFILKNLKERPKLVNLSRLSDAACTSYLVHPISRSDIDLNNMLVYTNEVRSANICLNLLAMPINTEPNMAELINQIQSSADKIMPLSEILMQQIQQMLSHLRPLTETESP
jgi:hypothetical protein